MRRVLAILACGLTVAGCASGSDALKSATPTTTLQFESEPAGAEVKTSTGQTCKTPCALAVPAADLMASYTLKGYKPQTVPVKLVPPQDTRTDSEGSSSAALPSFQPSPVTAELEKDVPQRKPAPRRPKPPASASNAPASDAPPPAAAPAARSAPAPSPMSPAPTAASPWPPAPNAPTQVR
jgi:hypothetical protein